jgi:hypothetical protein
LLCFLAERNVTEELIDVVGGDGSISLQHFHFEFARPVGLAKCTDTTPISLPSFVRKGVL